MKSGHATFPQGNVDSEPEALGDRERMRRELRLVDVAGELGFTGAVGSPINPLPIR